MLSGRFWRTVALPALILFLLPSLAQWANLNLLSTLLLLLTAGVILRQLQAFWGRAEETLAELRRFRMLGWQILLFTLTLVFLSNFWRDHYSTAAPGWISLPISAIALVLLLAAALQIIRLSPEAFQGKRGIFWAAIFLILVRWPGVGQFLVFFLGTAFFSHFTLAPEIPRREKVKLIFSCLVIFLFLALINFNPINETPGEETAKSTSPLQTSVFFQITSFLPLLLASLRNFILAQLIVLPSKLLLRPLADWLRLSLRIRTKLLLSYVLSSVIPGLLLVVIIFFGFLFLMGGYYQRFISQLIASQTQTMFVLLEPRASAPAPNWEQFSEQLAERGVTALLYKVSDDNQLRLVSDLGLPLPVTPAANVSYDSLGHKDFNGLAFFDTLTFLTQWNRQGSLVIGLFRRFRGSDLTALKSQCRTDLALYDAQDLSTDRVGLRGVSIDLGEKGLTPLLTTRTDSGKTPFDWISFPVLITGLRLNEQHKWEESQGFLLAETSLRSIFGNLLSTEYAFNRIYLILFLILAVILGTILILVAMIGFGLAGSITRNIGLLGRGTQQLSQGDLSVKIQVKSRDELGRLAGSFNQMVTQLNRMLEEVKEKERLEGELETARAIQMKLLPQQMPQIPGYDVAATSAPAKQVGGDYYDFLRLPAGQWGLVIGDVSGKGMPAALLMANLQASLHALMESRLSPGEMVGRLNRTLHANTASHMFATLVYGILDADQGDLHYVNAGHNLPFICGDGRMEKLTDGGIPLGILPEAEYCEGCLCLHRGELLVLYSDGIVEAMNSQDQEFGEEQLMQLLSRQCQDRAEDILQQVLRAVHDHSGTPQDDVTLMIIKRL